MGRYFCVSATSICKVQGDQMKTIFNFYENIYDDSKTEYITSQLKLTQVCNGFKVYKKLLPDLNTRLRWFTIFGDTKRPLEIRYRSGL